MGSAVCVLCLVKVGGYMVSTGFSFRGWRIRWVPLTSTSGDADIAEV